MENKMIALDSTEMKIFEDDAIVQFELEMLHHLEIFTPQQCDMLGETQLKIVIADTIKLASEKGLTNRGSVQLFIELYFIFGSQFYCDPLYPKFEMIFSQENVDQLTIANQLYEIATNYQEYSYDYSAVILLLKNFDKILQPQKIHSTVKFENEIIQQLSIISSHKIKACDIINIRECIMAAQDSCINYKINTLHGWTLIILLMFVYGRGCQNDVFFPWIHQILNDRRVIDTEARIKRLITLTEQWFKKEIFNSDSDKIYAG